MRYLVGLSAIIIMILIHELGHFAAGRFFGMPIREYSVGFGKQVLSFHGKRETSYSLRLLPIGGYCSFYDPSDFEDGDSWDPDKCLGVASKPKQILTYAAGPFANAVTGILLCFLIFFAVGVPTPTTEIASLADGYQAQEVLEAGDVVTSINGQDVADFASLKAAFGKVEDKEITFGIQRDGKSLTKTVTAKETDNRLVTGITFLNRNVRSPFFSAVKASVVTTGGIVASTADALVSILTGKTKLEGMQSIVGVVAIVAGYASSDQMYSFLYICAILAINLCMMNLLPIPGVDGGKIMVGVIEGISRRTIPETIKYRVELTCIALLLFASGMLAIFDITNVLKAALL